MTTNVQAAKGGKKEDKAKGVKAGLALIATAITGFRTVLQGIVKAEPIIAEAALYAVRHAQAHGDVSLADTLVKQVRGVMAEVAGKGKTHPMGEAMLNELVAWFRANSPIRWDAKGKCSIDKERGWKDKDLENAEDKGFFETDRALSARDAALKTQARELEPYTLQNFIANIKGLRKRLQSAMEPDKNGVIRGVKNGEAPKIRKLLDAVEEAASEVIGESIAPEQGPISARGKAKALKGESERKAA